jgi:general secretion pathway protein G
MLLPASSRGRLAPRSAFTLLEILVVVAIIVMLAGVGGYYFVQRLDDSKINRAKIDCQGLASQCEIFRTNNGEAPQSIEQLTQQQPSGGGPLVPVEKTKDPWGKSYQIEVQDHNGTPITVVFTTDPKGQRISNLDVK